MPLSKEQWQVRCHPLNNIGTPLSNTAFGLTGSTERWQTAVFFLTMRTTARRTCSVQTRPHRPVLPPSAATRPLITNFALLTEVLGLKRTVVVANASDLRGFQRITSLTSKASEQNDVIFIYFFGTEQAGPSNGRGKLQSREGARSQQVMGAHDMWAGYWISIS